MSQFAAMTARWLLRRQINASFFFLALLSTVPSISATNCYTPDGTISNDRPCNASASASVCCTQGFLCTSNQLCQPAGWWDGSDGNPLQFIRGTCTDKTWAAPECQGHCVADNPSGGEWVMRCGNTTNNYCCSADDCCTKASYLKFTLDEPTIIATAGIEPTSTATTMTQSSRETSTATTSTGTSTTPTPTTSAASSSNNSHSSTSDSTSIAIGVGVGVGVGVVIIGCLIALFVVRSHRKKRLAAEQNNSAFLPGSHEGPFGVYPPVTRVQHPSELDSQQQRHPNVAELDGVHTGKHEVR
ncbi:uncharacterized protein NFIA_108590 [Aspergillus fischeri NRRL 181]|uniref:Mid2 domain-containing protein n=1 Tax=Neosartorya fischeri (strain ATCC 1020 / DSM 3700 / CBS 544.65 / FGSC A1164 / JCM 1740 / NRRL 181 / WB 181) TaxID=331117 RepID=A1CXL3_NEOFI|nr:uncharacterized protein NFIA_108590 [Aspergillus fischeri NRRL 181]EAW25365.1 hypothetical protein NFIA_108590 [Aspergillus fischeri NRRL 181]KAG2024646.1 hypothetical protein GB937_003838 [Aspergillus fischeri]